MNPFDCIGNDQAIRVAIIAVIAAGAAVACSDKDKDAEALVQACAPEQSPIRIPGGSFMMGAEGTYPEEGPARDVAVGPFLMDPTEVTVSRFARFVEETGYVTVAERPVDPALYEGVDINDPSALLPGGAVFSPAPSAVADNFNWWRYAPGANWRFPRGPEKPPAAPEEPVTQIALADAAAFASWAGGRLPTEAEWEYAALAGRSADVNQTDVAPDNANTWQGIFPVQNTKADGYDGVAPVGCFPPNAFGLYDMIGNVWEWTADPHTPDHRYPGLPEANDGRAPPAREAIGLIKGGSYLCAQNYCVRYRPAARHAQETGLGTNHIGFRVVYDAEQAGE